MPTQAVTGFGSSFLYGASSPASTALGEALTIKGPGPNGAVIDCTNMSSPTFSTGVGAKEKIAGIVDAGKVTVSVNMRKAEVTALYALLNVKEYYEVAWSEGSKWDFQGFLTGMEPTAETNKQITMDLTIEITGVPTFTA